MSPAAPVLAEPSLPQISASREILALETAFRCKDGEATDEQRRLFRLLGTTNLLVLAVGVLRICTRNNPVHYVGPDT